MVNQRLTVAVSGIRQLTPRICEYMLTSLDGAKLPEHEAGAHIELYLRPEPGGQIVRHYSLIGGTGRGDDAPNTYRIAVQRERGRGSNFIHDHLDVGSRLAISPPRQAFALDRTDPHSLLIAGGIGITPIYAMLRSLARRKRSFSFFYSGRAAEELAYRDEVLSLAGERGQVHVSGIVEPRHPDLRALLAAQPEGTRAYVCGPRPMVEATRAAAAALGWAPGRVRSELFGAGSNVPARDFTVELRRSGREVKVGADCTILEALDEAGIPTLSDCRRGECGLCPLPVLGHDGALDHRDRYLSPASREAGKALCICVSRLNGARLVLDA
ncbi:PDR/VanB family oxidoreductase [Acidocella sp.]|uniref:PDR/VanB family oxidoreductase n=1 Tax=Acidocella sp. TaxID=50710 RepID=UPI00261A6D67|nr:PDR/VanB family oxidoreductase [Acidocella sp.]